MAKTLAQLIGAKSIWPTLQKELTKTSVPVEILPAHPEQAQKSVVSLQVSTGSDFGSVLYFTGGLLVDLGWVRVLGSGGGILRGLLEWNEGKTIENGKVVAGSVLIADDVLGGLFALNGGGALGKDLGKIYYLAPDTFQWESLGLGYSDFIGFLISGKLAEFYADYRFEGWQDMIGELTPDQIWQFGDEAETAIAHKQIVSINDWFNNILTTGTL